jgi:hypothetical protein
MSEGLATTLESIPFGIGSAVVNSYNLISCAWNQLSGGIKYAVQASIGLSNAAACGNPATLLGLIVVRGLLQCLHRLRLGTDAVVWATVDLNIEWDQAEATIDYLIRYVCPYGIPEPATAMALYRGGWISQGLYECWMRCGNADPGVYSPILEHGRPRPQLHERQQMLWRLRPDAVDPSLAYSDAQYLSEMAVDGSTDAWNKRLFAIRHIPYTLREIRQLMDAGQATTEEVYAAFRDMGYDDPKAVAQTNMEVVLTTRRREAEITGFTPGRISQLYMRGALQPDDVIANMGLLSYTQAQAQRLMQLAQLEETATQLKRFYDRTEATLLKGNEDGYKLGTVDAESVQVNLIALGASKESAKALVDAWDSEEKMRLAKETIATIKRGWKSGYLSNNNIADMLTSTGISADKANSIVAQWQLERTLDQRVEDVSQLLSQVAAGTMTATDAGSRLTNMGWSYDDAQLLLAESVNKLSKTLLAAEEKAITAAERAAKANLSKEIADKKTAELAVAKAAKAADALAKQAVHAAAIAAAQLRKMTPIASLAKWLKQGMISQEIYLQRLSMMGYEDGAAQVMMEEVCNAKGANCLPTAGPDDPSIAGL